MVVNSKEDVIDFEFLRGRQNETVVKELCVASTIASETFRFKPPHKMADHGSIENGINWMDGRIERKQLHALLKEAVADFAHIYAYGISKCTFLAGLTGRLIHNLEDVNCPRQTLSITSIGALFPATDFPNTIA